MILRRLQVCQQRRERYNKAPQNQRAPITSLSAFQLLNVVERNSLSKTVCLFQSSLPALRSLFVPPRSAAPSGEPPPKSEAIISCRGFAGARGRGIPKYALPRVAHAYRTRELGGETITEKTQKVFGQRFVQLAPSGRKRACVMACPDKSGLFPRYRD